MPQKKWCQIESCGKRALTSVWYLILTKWSIKYLSRTGFHTKKDIQIQDSHFKHDVSPVCLDQNLGFSEIGCVASRGLARHPAMAVLQLTLVKTFFNFSGQKFVWILKISVCSRAATRGCNAKLLICSSKAIVSLCGSNFFVVSIQR